MSDATTPANPTDQIAATPAVLSPETPIVPTSGAKRVPDDSKAAVVQDAQRYGHDEDDIVDALARWYMREAYQQLLAEREALLAEHEAVAEYGASLRDSACKTQRRKMLAAHDNAEGVIRG